MRKLNVVASSQPCHITLDPGGPERDLGLERSRIMWPFATYKQRGIRQAFGTDSPITPVTSMNVLYTAITRQDPKSHWPEGGWLPSERIDAATALRYSDAYFCKRFKQCFKVNFSAYLNEYRVGKARQLVLDPRLSLKDVSTACGYADANYFTRVFKRITGKTPSEYRLDAAGKTIQ